MITDRLKKVILTELNLEEFDFSEDMMANQVPGWDSLNHMNIIMAVENEYGFKFKALEILKMRKIGDLQKAIDLKLSVQ
jgi:acyl carrier protein